MARGNQREETSQNKAGPCVQQILLENRRKKNFMNERNHKKKNMRIHSCTDQHIEQRNKARNVTDTIPYLYHSLQRNKDTSNFRKRKKDLSRYVFLPTSTKKSTLKNTRREVWIESCMRRRVDLTTSFFKVPLLRGNSTSLNLVFKEMTSITCFRMFCTIDFKPLSVEGSTRKWRDYVNRKKELRTSKRNKLGLKVHLTNVSQWRRKRIKQLDLHLNSVEKKLKKKRNRQIEIVSNLLMLLKKSTQIKTN